MLSVDSSFHSHSHTHNHHHTAQQQQQINNNNNNTPSSHPYSPSYNMQGVSSPAPHHSHSQQASPGLPSNHSHQPRHNNNHMSNDHAWDGNNQGFPSFPYDGGYSSPPSFPYAPSHSHSHSHAHAQAQAHAPSFPPPPQQHAPFPAFPNINATFPSANNNNNNNHSNNNNNNNNNAHQALSPPPNSHSQTHSPNGGGSAEKQSSANNDPNSEYGQQLYKTELCRSYAESGFCRYGAKCRFAHGYVDLRVVQRHKKYKTERCKNYSRDGTCPYGQRCRFIHEQEIISTSLPLPSLSPLIGGLNTAPSRPAHAAASVPKLELTTQLSDERDGSGSISSGANNNNGSSRLPPPVSISNSQRSLSSSSSPPLQPFSSSYQSRSLAGNDQFLSFLPSTSLLSSISQPFSDGGDDKGDLLPLPLINKSQPIAIMHSQSHSTQSHVRLHPSFPNASTTSPLLRSQSADSDEKVTRTTSFETLNISSISTDSPILTGRVGNMFATTGSHSLFNSPLIAAVTPTHDKADMPSLNIDK